MSKVIMHVMGMDSTKYGGIEHYNVLLARELSSMGYRGVFLYESPPENQQFVNDLHAAGGELLVCNSRRNAMHFCIELAKLIVHYEPEVLHAHFTKARFYAIPTAYLCGIKKLFFTYHGEVGDKRTMKPWTRVWNQWAGHVAQVIAVSDNICNSFVKNWPKSNVKRVYLGVRDMLLDYTDCKVAIGATNDETIILSVANFNHIKGLDVLCEAIGILKRDNRLTSGIRFYIVGQPQWEIDELSPLVSQLDIGNHLVMTGIRNDVDIYMNAADIYIQPSRSEGISLTLMEAASAALPLIGTKTGGIPEVVLDSVNGMLVEKGNPHALADAIHTLISDINTRKYYGIQSRVIYTEHFNVNNNIQQLLSLYQLDRNKS